jgi:UDP-N-acetylglucosamine 1-carboxyvinyltransferase
VDRFVVSPNGPLSGTVRVGGAKNSVLKLMAACLLAEGRHVLSNVPRITDVDIMAELLAAMGVAARWGTVPGELVVETPPVLVPEAPYRLVEKMRASVVVLGPLLARYGRARVSMPGGDDFGHRPIDMHLHALEALGASFTAAHGYVEGRVDTSVMGRPALVGARVVLEYPSHTATDNLLMACVLAEGRSVIDNAAREPEVEDLGRQLIAMGARIEGLGTSRLTIDGVESLHAADHEVIPDRVVAATYLAAGLITGGAVRVIDARADHMEMLLRKIEVMGGVVDVTGPGIVVRGPARLRGCDVSTLPYPGVATDYKPLITTMLAVADGVSVVTENLFAGRFRYVDELIRLGSNITTDGHHAMIRGVDHLVGTTVRATDIRAAAALVLAGLVADGATTIEGLEHVERGYDDFVGRLTSLGARIERLR